ncbi:MFS general substrate transporter [Xylariomycetidae sp. FL0641]|nr:MFS general substrate transporter [Xylariomycetidae sp. FL0641]
MDSPLDKHDKGDVIISISPLSGSETTLPVAEEGPATAPDVSDDAVDCPDGGWGAWSQVLAGHFINTMAGGFGASFGVYQLYYTQTLLLSPSQVSWIGSFQVFLNNVVCVFAGRLSDAGYARATVGVGAALTLVGTFITSLASQYWQIFLAQGVCTGLGLGLMYMASITVPAEYFKKKRSLALALSSAGSGTGSIIFPATVQYLVPRVGFSWAVRCAGFVALVLVLLTGMLLRPKKRPRAAHTAAELTMAIFKLDWKVFGHMTFALFTAGTFLFFFALYYGFFYITTFATIVTGLPPASSTSILLITNGVGIPTRAIVGYIADSYLGPINMYITCNLLLAVTFFTWTMVATPQAMYGWAIVYGMCSAAAQGAFAGAAASPQLGSDDGMGERFGACCAVIAFAALAGPPAAGSILEAAGGGRMGFICSNVWAGGVTILAALVLALTRWWSMGVRGRAKV